MKTNHSIARWAVAMASAFALVSMPATAALMLSLSDGSNAVQIEADASGNINFNQALGSWILNQGVGKGSQTLGGAGLNLQSLHVSSIPTGGSGKLTVMLTETDLTGNGGSALADFMGTISGSTDGAVNYGMYVDAANQAFGLASLIGMPDVPKTGGAFSDAFQGMTALGSDPFSMTLQMEITHGDGDRATSFNFSGLSAALAVPEPGTLFLLGLGLVALGLRRRRTH